MGENNKEWQYDAFISYRHLEPDAFVAGSLHKILESYKLPSNLVKSKGDKLKRKKINKVFRDAEELPLTSNLNDTIMTALENSEYLIAICSPRFGESLWCKKEVDTFIEMRGADHVLTVLVEGEPSESFPDALLYKDVQKVLDDGSIITVREPMEPLAANARGANNKERLKLLKTEALRLMAPMFGCSFDDLKQRHREQRMKRITQIVGGVAAVCLLFGIVSTSMALKIGKQNVQIVEQNNQIVEQSAKIEEQYKEVVVSNANVVADYARNVFNDGDRIEAISKAYSVLDEENYVPKVEYVLSDALYLYENGRQQKIDRVLRCGSLVKDIVLSPSGEILAARTNDNSVLVWNTVNGKLITTLVQEKWSTEKDSVVFKDDNQFYMTDGDSVILYDIANQKSEVFATGFENDCKISYSEAADRLLAVDGQGAHLYEASTGTEIAVITDEKECEDGSLIVSGRDEFFAVAFGGHGNGDTTVYVCNTNDGSVVGAAELGDVDIAGIKFYGNDLYILANKTLEDGLSYMDLSEYRAVLCGYSIGDEVTEVWNKSFDGVYASDLMATKGGESDSIACYFYDKIKIVDRKSGAIIQTYDTGSQIVKMFGYRESDIYSAVTRDGEWLAIDPSRDETIDTGFFDSVSNNIELFASGSCTATTTYSSGEIMIYRYALALDAAEIDEVIEPEIEEIEMDHDIRQQLDDAGINSKFVHNICYDNTGRFMGVVYLNHTMDVFRIDSNNSITDKCASFGNFDSYLNMIKVSPDEKMVVIYDSYDAYILKADGCDFDNSFPDESQIVAHVKNFCGIDFDNKTVYVKNYDQYYKVPLYDTKEVAEIAKRQIDEIQ